MRGTLAALFLLTAPGAALGGERAWSPSAAATSAAAPPAAADSAAHGARLEDDGAADDADPRGALHLVFGGGASYGRRAAGVQATGGLGVRAGSDTYLLAKLDLGLGQMIGTPGDLLLHAETVGMRDGMVFLGLEHRAARGRPYSYWGWVTGADIPMSDASLWSIAVSVGVGVSTDTRDVDWTLRAGVEFALPLL